MDIARYSIGAAVAVALSTPCAAIAQEAVAQATQSEDTAGDKKQGSAQAQEPQLDEVRVQATPGTDSFRATDANVGALGDRPLLDTPFSINVVTEALIENQQMATPQDVFKNDPSFAYGFLPIPWTTLRGFLIGTGGYLYDGLPAFVALNGGRNQLQGIERIDIMKGASVFLNGMGATSSSLGGVLNYIPKRPLDTPVRTISASYETESLFGVHADIGDRFGAERQFGYRTNLAYRDGEQSVKGSRWEQTVATLAADWRASPDLVFNGTFDYVDNKTPRFQSFFLVAPGVAVPAAPNARQNLSFSWNDFQQQDYRGTLRADWAFAPDWSMTAQALLGHTWRPTVFAGSTGLITNRFGDTLTLNSANTLDTNYGSGQVLVHGKFPLGPLSNQFTGGIAGEGENQKSAQGRIPMLPSNLYFPRDYPNLTPAMPDTRRSLRSRSYSILLSDIIGWGEQWSVLVGGRYVDLDQDNYSLVTGAITTSASVSKTTPALALMFKPVPEALIYGSYVEGLEAGATAPAGTVNANQALPPAVTEQYEIGAKWQLKDLLLTLAAFDMTRPLNFVDPVTNRYVQQGEQRHKGVEFLATGRVTPDFNLVGGIMYIDPENVATGNPLTSGKRPPGVPDFTANLYGEYRIGALQGLFLTGGIYYAAKQYANATNTASIPSWTRFDLGARYETFAFGKPASILFAVENVANRNYWSNANSGFLSLGLPLTVRLTARMSF